MSRWLFDLGNTRLKWTVQEHDRLQSVRALPHREPGLDLLLDRALAELPRAREALIASVAAPDLAARVGAICHRHGVPSRPVRSRPECAGVRIAYADPDSLGVDRFLALLAARRRGPGAWLIVGVGTALTVDLLDRHGGHRGGLIAPSPDLMRHALARHTARLDERPGRPRPWGRNTADALAGGVHAAALGLIERSHALACDEIEDSPMVLISGGGAPALIADLPLPAEHAPDLVIDGLAVYAEDG